MGRSAILSGLMAGTFAVVLATCGPETVPLPDVKDPAFTRLAGVELGMRRRELSALGREIEVTPDGEVREPYGRSGWITYVFEGPVDARLARIRWNVEYADSTNLRRRWDELAARLREAYGTDPVCTAQMENRLRELRAVWPGPPGTGVSAQTLATGDHRTYYAELVMIVEREPLATAVVGRKEAACTL